ncbi:MAG: TetR/AcrR family transcriptional regulator, partial [Rhodococcus sp. (in: high G+C Gram-positive bacteria)]
AQALRVWAIDHLATLARECVSNADTDEAVLKTFFSRYLTESVGPLIPVLGGRLPEHAEVTRAAAELEAALQSMVDACIDTREVPPDFTSADVMLMTVHLRPTLPIEGDRATEIHTRYLDFMLDGLRGGKPRPSSTPPSWSEWLQMWQGN